MALTGKQMARLGELLDAALPLTLDERRTWLESLPAEDEPLRRTLRDALMSEDPTPLADRLLGRPPTLGSSASAVADEHHTGDRLGAYELLKPLGAGGMAEVWLARRADGAFERQVALKIPRLGRLPAEMSERFARECRILASLEVPGIARLYDAGIERGLPYLAMEYVPGEPLTRWCESRRPDMTARIALLVRVIESVGRAHAQQVVHRDLKPSNILVTPEGDPRLLDFGIARLLEAEPEGVSVTQAWGRALTPEYASPEMLRGESVDARADIYSLGVVLHELLTGKRPGDMQAIGGDHDAVTLSSGLRRVISKALAPSPADRFADATSFAAALRPYADGGATARTRGLHAWRAALVTLGAGALIAAGYLGWSRVDTPAPAAARPAAAAEREVSLAVLPFADLSQARDQDYLSEGMADEIINQLAQIKDLRLVGLRSSLLFKGRHEDLRVIGGELGVDNLLDGSIRKSGDRLRVTAQLVRARDGTPLWSKVYERELTDVFAVQEEIARDVSQALPVKLDVGPMSRAEGGTTNLDAYEPYLRWRQLFLAERHGEDDHRERARLLREAVHHDPDFVLAWGELAAELERVAVDVDALAGQTGAQAASLRADAVRARARVLELAPESWMGLRIRSEQLANEHRWAESIELARRILDSGPFTLERAYPYINVIFAVGRLDETIALVERVIRIEPLVMFPSRDQQWNLTAARRYREAAAEYQRTAGFEGSHTTPDLNAFLRTMALEPSNVAAVKASYQRFRDSHGASGRTSFFAELGPVIEDRDALRVFVRELIEKRAPGFINAYGIADALGEPEHAWMALRAWLDDPGAARFDRYWELWIVPYSNLRTLPGFKQTLREAGIADYWRTTGHWGDFCRPVGDDDFECR